MSLSEVLAYCHERSVELRLDGDRLKLVGNKSAIDEHLLSLVRQHKPGLIELLRSGQGAQPDEIPYAIEDAQRDAPHSPSFNQQRMWFVQQLQARDDAAAYNGAVALELHGEVRADALQGALQDLLQRHESLRTALVQIDGEPRQRVRAQASIACRRRADVDDAALDAAMREELSQPFDLAADTLIRATLYTLAPRRHVLLLVTHHITSDAWSLEILIRDFGHFYNARCLDQAPRLPALPLQYLDFARWERAQLSGARLQGKLSAWSDYLRDAPRLHALPCDRPRQASGGGGELARIERMLDPRLVERLEAAARDQHTTLFTVLAALYSATIHRLGDRADVLFGMPVSNRMRPEFEPIAGYFSNTVVVRNRLPEQYSLSELVAVVKDSLRFVLAHQDVPFDMLVDELRAERSLSMTPLYQLWFSMHENRTESVDMHELRTRIRAIERSRSRYDLKLEANRTGSRLVLNWEYDSGLFEAKTVDAFADCFERLADALTGAEAPAPIVSGGDRFAPAAEVLTLARAWTRDARDHCDEIAVSWAEGALTRAQIELRANRLAGLIAELGAGAGDRVGVCADAGPEALIATLAIWKLGAVCMPLEPLFARERIGESLAAAQPVLVLATAQWAELPALRQSELVLLQDVRDPDWLADYDGAAIAADSSPDDHALWLPGRTAMAKLSHADMARNSAAFLARHGIADGLNYAFGAVNDHGFAGLSLRLALAARGHLHVLPRECRIDAARMSDFLRSLEIDVIECAAHDLADAAADGGVTPRGWLLRIEGAEWARPLRCSLDSCRVVDCLGADETGLIGLSGEPAADAGHSHGECSGEPLAPLRGEVLQGELAAPAGAWGELVFSAGAGASARAWRSGWRARRGAGARVHVSGAYRDAPHWRGFRLDPRRTLAALNQLPGVVAAAVLVDDIDGHDGCSAYVVADSNEATLQQQLKTRLPHYLLPQRLIVLPALPLTAAGALDRRALPRPERSDRAAPVDSPVVRELQAIWCELLSRPSVEPHAHFFEIGGHSLLATRMLNRARARIWAGLALTAIFDHPVLADLAAHIEREREPAVERVRALPPIPRGAGVSAAPLSFGQQQLWLVDRIEQGSSHYNMVAGFRLLGALDTAALNRALAELIRRHAALRTRFVETDAGVAQHEDDARGLSVALEDYRAIAADRLDDLLDQRLREEAAHRFDLGSGELIRVVLLRTGEKEHLLALNVHHIACDGWSIEVMIEELRQLYAAYGSGEEPSLRPLPVAYGDYARWQREWLAGEAGRDATEFWREQLDGAPPMHALPIDHPRPAQADHVGAEWIDAIGVAELDGLRALARESGTTLFICLQSLFALFVARLSGSDDVVLGTAVSGRAHADTEPMVGLFANLIALRAKIDPEQALRDYLVASHLRVTRAFDQQHYPFEQLVAALNPERSLGAHPVFQLAFALKQARAKRIELAQLRIEPLPRSRVDAKFDLMLSAVEHEDGLRLEWQYATALFQPESIAAMAAQFKVLLASASASAGAGSALGDLNLIGEEDARFLAQHADGAVANAAAVVGEEECVYARFARMAAADPDAIALSGEDIRVTYAQLQAGAERLAGGLAAIGVREGDRVGVYLRRGVDLIECLLAILRLGAAYVPMDSGYPAARIQRMARDSQARVFIAEPDGRAMLDSAGVPATTLSALRARRDAAPPLPAHDPRRMAYLMYTSGSTGEPKGVAIAQRSILRLVRDRGFMRLTARTAMLQLAPVAFDASTLEIWGPLLNGGRLAIYPDRELDLSELSEFIAEQKIDSLWLTAALFEQWAQRLDRPLPHLRWVLTGGDVVPPAAVRRLYDRLDQVEIVNGYGPTENTTFTCCHRIARDWPGDRPVPIGRPIHGGFVRVLDARGRTQPVGAVGELYAGGDGVALGYWRRSELDAERFARDPDSGQLLYRTGDLVRWQRDGALQYLGRGDTQIKLRGYRIEPAEIERCLLAQGQLREVSVVVREHGERQLVAYYTALDDADAAMLADALRSHAREHLPRYMVPSAFVAMAALPLTPNGKLDRRALPEPSARDRTGLLADASTSPPETDSERLLAGLWRELLAIDEIGADDDFFALGGNSLLAVRMLSELRQRCGRSLPARELFLHGSVREFARRLDAAAMDAAGGDDSAPIAAVPRGAPLPTSYAQQRLWFIDRIEGRSRQYNMPALFELRGELDLPALQLALDALSKRHEVLRTRYQEIDGHSMQIIAASAHTAIDYRDLRELPEPEREAHARSCLDEEAIADFDLGHGPIFKLVLLRLGERDYRMLFNMHHIASDGWSVGVLIRDLVSLYRAQLAGSVAELPALSVQYADYAVWQREQLSPRRRADLADYWRARLSELPQLHALPLDKPRPPRMSSRGEVVRGRIDSRLTDRLNALARDHGASLFIVLQSLYALLLARIGGESDVVVGTPVAGRDTSELEHLVGCFVNTVVLRNAIDADTPLADYLRASRDMVLDAFDHQQLPFEMLVEELNPVRSASHLPLFQLWFVLQNMQVGRLELPGLEIAEVAREEVSAKFDLMLSATERDGGIDLNWVYNADLFERGTVQSWADSFAVLLESAAQAPRTPVGRLPLLSADQRQWLERRALGPGKTYSDATVFAQFRERARQHPQRVALRSGERTLSYGQLADRADRLGGYLLELGVKPGEKICVSCDRSLEQVIAVLGIWQAGAAFVPVDWQTPRERAAFIQQDTGAGFVLASRQGSDLFDLSKVDLLVLDGAVEDEAWLAEFAGQADHSRADELAYVIYTSGTTGRPKGVMIDHASLSNLGHGLNEVLADNGIATGLRWAWNAPLVFDASLQALAQLAVGGELHLLSETTRKAPDALLEYLRTHAIEMLDCTPSLLELVMQQARRRDLALPHVLVGGEAIHAGQWQEIAQWMARSGTVALNVYGPTETTVDATWARIDAGTPASIGRPLPNVRVRVLDERLQDVPPGALGECVIGGAGVARGYLNRAELQAERFVALPDAGADERYYRSGDMVRWMASGELAYLHRRDSQVKLRGYRIELSEIEQVLLEHAQVADAAVIVSAATGSLLAYVVSGSVPVSADALAEHCRRTLPEYMVPTVFIALPQLPLTGNGKLDLQALPEPLAAQTGETRDATPTEARLREIWGSILGRADLPLDGNFFTLGGHSLLAIRVISAIREQLGVELALSSFFERPSIAQLAQTLDASQRRRALPPIAAEPGRERAPLSYSQNRLWLIDRLEGGSPQYNMPAAFELRGRFDAQACRSALEFVLRRHEILRTVYADVDGQPVQIVRADATVPMESVDLTALSAQAQDVAVERAIREDARQPFDLGRDTMLRARLLRLAEDRQVLIFNMHHIASDGWSVGVLVREFARAYAAFADGRADEPEPLPIQYADYACWQQRELSAQALAPELDYWKQTLQGLPQVHSLPLDRPRPIRQTYRGATVTRRLAASSLSAFAALCREHEATLFVGLHAAFAALLARWSNEADIVVGTPVAGRNEQSLEPLIGFFLNTLVLRSDLSGNPRFDELLRRERERTLGAFSHQNLPFEMLIDALKPERSLSHPALFQIMLVLQNQEQATFELEGASMRVLPRGEAMAKFDLLLNANQIGEELELSWTYNVDLFDAATIERMADGLEQILECVIRAPDTRLNSLNLLPPAESERILRDWNATAAELPYEQCLHDLFLRQVRRAPDAVAVIDEHGQISYRELFAQAAALAERVRPHAARAESLIAVLLPKGRGQVVATLGIMMAGAAYLPLDTSWPAARIDQVLEHGGAVALVTQGLLADGVQHGAARIDVDTVSPLPPAEAGEALRVFVSTQAPDALAYVIFTSGSTGRPKGVAIEHRSAVNTILDINQRYAVGRDDAVLAVSALSFDLSVYDLFGLLGAGGRIVFPDEARQKDPRHWAELVERHGVTVWDSVPASAELLTAQYEWRDQRGGGLRVLMMSGDWIPPTLPARIAAVFSGVDMHSLGGATEGSIWSISYPIREDMSQRKSVPYGKPLANQAFYILTDDLAPCPVGVVGELHIGGIGVAREYYADPERTAASYVRHPWIDDRLYKTGDIGRYLPDGNIEFVGRKDLQVKIRGFRIELGEIEAALNRCEEVADAVVMVVKDPTEVQQLVAYVCLHGDARAQSRDWSGHLRAQLVAALPSYMVPTHYVFLDAFPLSANNKVDRKRLPMPEWDQEDALYSAPVGPIEELLAGVWEQVLGRERISAERNFFELGGSSVHLIEIAGKSNLLLGEDIGVVSFFEHPTIRAMARFLAGRESPARAEPAARRSKGRLSDRLAKRGER